MSVSLDVNRKTDDVGRILAKVQDDIQCLRAAVARAGEGELDLQTLDLAIARTERGVQAAAEKVVHAGHSTVETLPAVTQQREKHAAPEGRSMQELVAASRVQHSTMKQARMHTRQTVGLSPGQQAQVDHMSWLVSSPSHPVTKHLLTDHYNLPTPSVMNRGRESKPLTGQIVTGSTVDALTALPRLNRRDAQLTPPAISQDDARKGLLSLLERGLIPPAAELVLSPPPVQPRTVKLHSPAEQHARQLVAEPTSTQLTGVKLDPSDGLSPPTTTRTITVPAPDRTSYSSACSKFYCVSVKMLEAPLVVGGGGGGVLRSKPSPKSPLAKRKNSNFKVVIQNGSIVEDFQEFAAFKKAFRQNWSNVQAVLVSLVELCGHYAVPLALAEGDKISRLAFEYELGLKPSRNDLVASLSNAQEVRKLMQIPGRRYLGTGGMQAAAAKIQATVRMFIKRTQYLNHRKMKWAAGVITISWIMCLKMSRIRRQLKVTRAKQLESNQQRGREFQRRWDTIKKSKRTIVHIPSQGHSQPVRAQMKEFNIQQAHQLARICDVRDPNVEVLYISPVPVEGEVLEYYQSLLALGPAGETAMERVHIITPERMETFSQHNMSLSTILMYSESALSRVKSLLAGREAYIVPGVVGRDDITIADQLGLPILGSDSELTKLYSTNTGAKRIFADAKVSMAPSCVDVFGEEQLIERLASLVANHLTTPRWLFKLPHHIRGSGFAYCDVLSHLHCYSWVLHEAERYGEKWHKKWAQEYAVKKIASELPVLLAQHARTVDTELFPSWTDFLAEFCSQGGVIEGCPHAESVTSLSVDVLIEPTGNVNILSTQDQVCGTPYCVWGVTVPQTSVPPAQLTEAITRVATACKARGMLGHFSVDFVTFIDPQTLSQELWAVDLDVGYSDHLALYNLLSYLTGASLDVSSGQLRLAGGGESRYAVLSAQLLHTNLSVIYYPIFFQMCKAHHIGYDTQTRTGTVFALVDGQHREHLGMLCLQESLVQVLDLCCSSLATIHQEVSTPRMQGCSNFEAASRELLQVRALLQTNQEEGEEEEEGERGS